MSLQNAATPAPAVSGNGRQKFATATSRISDSANSHRSQENSRSRALFAEAAREYRAALPRRSHEKPKGEPASELTQFMRRAFIADCLERVPEDVAGAQLALDRGDDGEAFHRLTRVVIAVKEAARTFNELRADAPKARVREVA